MLKRATLVKFGAICALVTAASLARADDEPVPSAKPELPVAKKQSAANKPDTSDEAAKEEEATAEKDKKPAKPPFSFSALKADGSVKMDAVTVGAEYSKKHEIDIDQPFRVAVPKSEEFIRLALYPADLDGGYLKITFATPDKEFIENIQFTSLSIDVGDLEDRQKKLAAVLKLKGWKQVVKNFGENKIDLIRAVKINENDAVELIGRYIDKENGVIVSRLVAIFREGDERGVFVVANIAAGMSSVTNLEEMNETISAAILNSFEFVEKRKE